MEHNVITLRLSSRCPGCDQVLPAFPVWNIFHRVDRPQALNFDTVIQKSQQIHAGHGINVNAV